MSHIRPKPYNPLANSPFSTSNIVTPRFLRILIFCNVAWFKYMSRSIAGAQITGAVQDRNVANKMLSHKPVAIFEIVFAVAGAIRIKSGSSEDIGKEIINLFNNEDKRRELSLKGRKRMEDLFDWKISASHYVKVFEDTMKIFNT